MSRKEVESQYDAERYLLGEMSTAEEEEFELKMFESEAVSDDVRDLLTFTENAKAVFEEEARAKAAGPAPIAIDSGRSARHWSSPAVLWPVAAALLLAAVGFQAGVVVPRLEEQLAKLRRPQAVETAFLRPLTRGDDNVVTIEPSQPLVRLSFDVPLSSGADTVLCRVETVEGEPIFDFPVGAAALESGTLEISLPADPLETGAYHLLLSVPGGETISRFQFRVERIQ